MIKFWMYQPDAHHGIYDTEYFAEDELSVEELSEIIGHANRNENEAGYPMLCIVSLENYQRIQEENPDETMWSIFSECTQFLLDSVPY